MLERSFDAARAAGSVHIVGGMKSPTLSQKLLQDAGAAGGSQDITGEHVHAHVRVIGSNTYVRGDDAATLSGFFGLSASVASAYAGRWIHPAAGSDLYEAATEGVRLADVLAEVQEGAVTKVLGEQTRQGQLVVGLAGTATVPDQSGPVQFTFWIRATGAPLPVEQDATLGPATTSVEVFSDWGEPIHVSAPSGSLAMGAAAATTG
jgi:hypothetical protein